MKIKRPIATMKGETRTLGKVIITSALLSSSFVAMSETKFEGLQPTKTQRGFQVENVEISKPRPIQIDLRRLPRAAHTWTPGKEIEVNPKVRKAVDPRLAEMPIANPVATNGDSLLAAQSETLSNVTRSLDGNINIEGLDFSGVNPPDPVGDVGKNYYIQGINGSGGTEIAVYNKADGSLETNFILDSLGSGNCASGLGDPIILYDEQAERWLLSEFSSGGNRMCVYISQTDDPLSGGWFNYDFQAQNFPDYPKYGVWTDAYYVGTNESSGPTVYAFDREAMLNGEAATLQRFVAPDLSGFGFQMITPADADGTLAPPAGAPGYFMRHNDDESHSPGSNNGSQDFLEIFEFNADFDNPANASFTGPIRIPIEEIDSSLCGLFSFSCIDQPNSSVNLDPLREVVMYRLSYRNFGSYEALIGNLSTDVGGDRAGVRWFELRKSGNAQWALHQEGTYAPGDVSRWMGGIAMDGQGNIALAYNVSNASVFPSIRYTGRLASDPLGVMTQSETVLVAGTGANSSNRYGDYSSMNVDPVDNCTFWFTGEYSVAGGQWRTRIGSFAFEECLGGVGENFTFSGANLTQSVCTGENIAPIELQLTPIGDFSGVVDLAFSGLPAGATGNFSSASVTPPGSSTATVNTSNLASGSYEFSILAEAQDLESQSLAASVTVNADPGNFNLSAPADGAEGVSIQPTFSWQAANFADSYLVEIDDDADFSSIEISSTVSGGTNFIPLNTLNSNTTYYWRVTAINDCNEVQSAVSSFTTTDIVDEAQLQNGIPKTNISGEFLDEVRFYLDVPATASNLSFSISGGTGDADLYVRFGAEPTTSTYDCRPYRNGNVENCDFTAPQEGRYFVMLRGYRAFSGVTLLASYEESLPPVVEVFPGLSGDTRGDVEIFTLDIPAGASDFVVTLEGDNGDADLYINLGSEPTYGSDGNFICREIEIGSNEVCTIASPAAGTYFIAVRVWDPFTNVTLTTSYQP